MNKLLNILTYSLLVVCVLAFNYACTEYDTPAEIADDGTIDTGISTKIHRKVLWINIDGAVGEVVKNSLPADGAIAKMLKNSKYSWTGVSDNRTLSLCKVLSYVNRKATDVKLQEVKRLTLLFSFT